MLDWEPQSLEELRARYPAALEYLYVIDPLQNKPNAESGLRTANVFEFKDGMRLVVSREQFQNWQYLHVSASANPHSPIGAAVWLSLLSRSEFCEHALAHYRAISGVRQAARRTTD